MMYWYGPGMNGWGYTLMTVSAIVFWTLVVVGLVALIRYVARRPQDPLGLEPTRPTPEQLLAERFARGEIDADEYGRSLEILQQHAHSAP